MAPVCVCAFVFCLGGSCLESKRSATVCPFLPLAALISTSGVPWLPTSGQLRAARQCGEGVARFWLPRYGCIQLLGGLEKCFLDVSLSVCLGLSQGSTSFLAMSQSESEATLRLEVHDGSKHLQGCQLIACRCASAGCKPCPEPFRFGQRAALHPPRVAALMVNLRLKQWPVFLGPWRASDDMIKPRRGVWNPQLWVPA